MSSTVTQENDDGVDVTNHSTLVASRLGGRNLTLTKRLAPDEVLAPSTEEEAYIAYRRITDWREPYRIPPLYLEGTKNFIGPKLPDTPLIAFINAKSGGRVGPALAGILFRSLGQSQVFDVTEHRPKAVLEALYRNLITAEGQGDAEAAYIRRTLRILVAGGDGTVTWVLGSIIELGIQPPPPVAVMPLGTGNDFSFNFGWGTKFERAWVRHNNLYRTLARYKDATARCMDVWRLNIQAPSSALFQDMPHSLSLNESNPSNASARFWNYYSVGLDAEAAYGFHHLRETHPRLTSGRAINQAWYSVFSCTSGWFCGAKPLANTVKIKVKDVSKNGGVEEWRDVVVPPSIRALVLLNLQSYGGGRDIWGLADTSSLESKGLKEPIYDDGMIEVLGFHSGWHTAAVMGQVSPKVHALRLAQCSGVEMHFVATGSRVKGDTGTVYMQIDGEPWPQSIPAIPFVRSMGKQGDKGGSVHPLIVRVEHGGTSMVLVNSSDKLGNKKSQWVTERGLELATSMTSDSDLV